MRKITVTNVEYSGHRLGFGFNDVNRQKIFNNEQAPMRILNYRNNYQFAMTFEQEKTLYEVVKSEYTVIKFLSNMGGLSSKAKNARPTPPWWVFHTPEHRRLCQLS